MNNTELRLHLRTQRLLLPEAMQHAASHQVCHFALQLNRYRLSEHIAFYLKHEAEIDPLFILEAAFAAGKKCYLPVLHPRKIGELCFMPYAPLDPLIPNRYGILEPKYHADLVLPVWHLDLVFAPLVAFDHDKNRLGMGKGYYDRTFSFVKHDENAHKPYLVGLAYEFQKVVKLNAMAHDVRMHEVITEQGLVI